MLRHRIDRPSSSFLHSGLYLGTQGRTRKEAALASGPIIHWHLAFTPGLTIAGDVVVDTLVLVGRWLHLAISFYDMSLSPPYSICHIVISPWSRLQKKRGLHSLIDCPLNDQNKLTAMIDAAPTEVEGRQSPHCSVEGSWPLESLHPKQKISSRRRDFYANRYSGFVMKDSSYICSLMRDFRRLGFSFISSTHPRGFQDSSPQIFPHRDIMFSQRSNIFSPFQKPNGQPPLSPSHNVPNLLKNQSVNGTQVPHWGSNGELPPFGATFQ
ncbi:hypothetical protein FNV43_RR19397 [Rhamnella rubrinervis]|uniref:Uncharacterized protein n=1 Tax=Rhamnella rubrinervis TaxID=2594499 RepID=A0A8K0DZI8_9ROSA|nr:hypothetical protein FNV43_RR19397 [Rhamnella rubrinervis]